MAKDIVMRVGGGRHRDMSDVIQWKWGWGSLQIVKNSQYDAGQEAEMLFVKCCINELTKRQPLNSLQLPR
jgi:hypothetical protein